MLFKGYKEGRPSDGSQWVIHLPEDDPEAFDIIANIIHGNVHKLPRGMSIHIFYKTCILAEKYLMLHVLRNHVRQWYDKMWWCVYRRNGQIDPDEIQQHTSIACLLGNHKSLWAAITYYAYACRVVDDELIHWRKDPLLSGSETQSEVGEITEYSKLLAEEVPFLPEFCFDIIQALRLELLEKIMGTKEYLGWLGSVFCFGGGEHSPACKLDDISETDCERIVFAQIRTVMDEYGLTEKAPFLLSGDWAASVNELVDFGSATRIGKLCIARTALKACEERNN
ncbi:hypothetical protein SLS53_004887 [Cytospora paraplurivora]|uniref:Uncharacterized protein n=1 Tax=Cytospora paraplurivora TaxID=2898453 RepID=A0AAN9U6I6_9PEZI